MRLDTWIVLVALLGGCSDDATDGAAPEPAAGEGEGEPAPAVARMDVRFHRESVGHMQFLAPITGRSLRDWQEGGPDPDAVKLIPALVGLPGQSWFAADATWVAWLVVEPALALRLSPVGSPPSMEIDLTGLDNQLNAVSLGFAGPFFAFALAQGVAVEIRALRTGGQEPAQTVTTLDEGGGFTADPWHPRIMVSRRSSLVASELELVPLAGGAATPIASLTVPGADTGGDYTGREPGAFSPDGSWFALATSARAVVDGPGELRLRIFSTAGGEVGGVRLGPGGQARCDAALGEDEFVEVRPGLVWGDDSDAVYLIGVNEVGCGFDGISDDTGLIGVPVGPDGAPGAPRVMLRDDHPTNPAVLHQVAPTADGDVVVALQEQGRARGTSLYWGAAAGGVSELIRLTAPASGQSDQRLRVRAP